jgi:hypothetical protein
MTIALFRFWGVPVLSFILCPIHPAFFAEWVGKLDPFLMGPIIL